MNINEFIGVMIGDGCLLDYPKYRQYGIEISGNATEEKDYYQKLSMFIKDEFKLNSKVFVREYKDGSHCLKLTVHNKKFALYLKNTYGLAKSKTYTVKIPSQLMNWEEGKHVLRGIFETDGSLYFSKSRITTNKPTYPRLEITTVSHDLAAQIVELLANNGFKVQCHNNRGSIVIYLSGVRMLEKWIEEIGFSSQKNWTKYFLWKKLGYYIPRITLSQRELLLAPISSQKYINSDDSECSQASVAKWLMREPAEL